MKLVSTMLYVCEICQKGFSHSRSLNRHKKTKHIEVKCDLCEMKFNEFKELVEHKKLTHDSNKKEQHFNYCDVCEKNILQIQWPYHLGSNEHEQTSKQQIRTNRNVNRIKSVVKGRIETYVFENPYKTDLVPENFFQLIKRDFFEIIKYVRKKCLNYKFNCELSCKYVFIKEDEVSFELDWKSHRTNICIAFKNTLASDIEKLYEAQCTSLISKMSEFQESDSGWSLIEISRLEVNINTYKPFNGSTYISLPAKIRQKHACVNVQNTDDYSFKWSIISALSPNTTNKDRCASYKINNINDDIIVLDNDIELNFQNLHFPLQVKEIQNFEINNPMISVNVYGLDDDTIIGPIHHTRREKSHHINLLLLEDIEVCHYVWIRNISRLLRSQLTGHKNRIYMCHTCLSFFHSGDLLARHKGKCSKTVTDMVPVRKKN